jgi:hypothetical protein
LLRSKAGSLTGKYSPGSPHVIPAKAGIHAELAGRALWIPAVAGMTGKNFRFFFKKTLKFPKTLPLPVLDAQQTVWERQKKFLKFFRQNPKVLQNAAVTGLDVVKKSRFAALFFDLKG